MQTKLLFIITLACFGSIIPAYAQENDCCNDECTCHWSYDAATKTINITGTGAIKGYNTYQDENQTYHTKAPWQIYESEAKNVNIAEGITSIGHYAFYHVDIQNINIPSSVSAIGIGTFQDSDLTQVIIPEGVKDIRNAAFHNNPHLADVILPNTLESIDIYAFGATDIQSLVIPENVTIINDMFNDGAERGIYIQELYCTSVQMAQCEAVLNHEESKNVKPIRYEKSGNDYLVYDSKGNVVGKYASIGNLQKGTATETYKYDSAGHLVGIFDGNGQRTWGKKIYTVEEAMEATKNGDKFHVYLTYK